MKNNKIIIINFYMYMYIYKIGGTSLLTSSILLSHPFLGASCSTECVPVSMATRVPWNRKAEASSGPSRENG